MPKGLPAVVLGFEEFDGRLMGSAQVRGAQRLGEPVDDRDESGPVVSDKVGLR